VKALADWPLMVPRAQLRPLMEENSSLELRLREAESEIRRLDRELTELRQIGARALAQPDSDLLATVRDMVSNANRQVRT